MHFAETFILLGMIVLKNSLVDKVLFFDLITNSIQFCFWQYQNSMEKFPCSTYLYRQISNLKSFREEDWKWFDNNQGKNLDKEKQW